jgi:predicted DNA-binding protein (UPF0251 family)
MRKQRRSVPAEGSGHIVESYLQGVSSVVLAEQADVTNPTLVAFLKKAGVSIRTRSEINRLRAPIDDVELMRLSDEAILSQAEIAHKFGVSLPTIERALRRLGTRSKKGRGSALEKNYFWKGGRTQDVDGYVLVKSPGHPFADKRGYVREHRLVMEQTLGRYLHPKEVVHHIDGDKRNNAPSNLEVFQTNADHLRHELTGKTPNYSPDGLRRMRENAQRINRLRSASTARSKKLVAVGNNYRSAAFKHHAVKLVLSLEKWCRRRGCHEPVSSQRKHRDWLARFCEFLNRVCAPDRGS